MDEIEQETMNDPEMTISQALAAIEIIIKDKITAVSIKGMETLSNILNNVNV